MGGAFNNPVVLTEEEIDRLELAHQQEIDKLFTPSPPQQAGPPAQVYYTPEQIEEMERQEAAQLQAIKRGATPKVQPGTIGTIDPSKLPSTLEGWSIAQSLQDPEAVADMLDRTTLGSSVGGALHHAGATFASVANRLASGKGVNARNFAAEQIQRYKDNVEQGLQERSGGFWTGDTLARGALSSIATMAPSIPLGGAAPIGMAATFMMDSLDSAYADGAARGLRGQDLQNYAKTAAAAEGIPMTVFSAAGFGGVEKNMIQVLRATGGDKAVAKGFLSTLREIGIDTFAQELPEELITAAATVTNEVYAGLREKPTSAELFDLAAQTTAQTVVTGGIVNAPKLLRSAKSAPKEEAAKKTRRAAALEAGVEPLSGIELPVSPLEGKEISGTIPLLPDADKLFNMPIETRSGDDADGPGGGGGTVVSLDRPLDEAPLPGNTITATGPNPRSPMRIDPLDPKVDPITVGAEREQPGITSMTREMADQMGVSRSIFDWEPVQGVDPEEVPPSRVAPAKKAKHNPTIYVSTYAVTGRAVNFGLDPDAPVMQSEAVARNILKDVEDPSRGLLSDDEIEAEMRRQDALQIGQRAQINLKQPLPQEVGDFVLNGTEFRRLSTYAHKVIDYLAPELSAERSREQSMSARDFFFDDENVQTFVAETLGLEEGEVFNPRDFDDQFVDTLIVKALPATQIFEDPTAQEVYEKTLGFVSRASKSPDSDPIVQIGEGFVYGTQLRTFDDGKEQWLAIGEKRQKHLYHVTLAGSQIRESGMLRAANPAVSDGGLGGGSLFMPPAVYFEADARAAVEIKKSYEWAIRLANTSSKEETASVLSNILHEEVKGLLAQQKNVNRQDAFQAIERAMNYFDERADGADPVYSGTETIKMFGTLTGAGRAQRMLMIPSETVAGKSPKDLSIFAVPVSNIPEGALVTGMFNEFVDGTGKKQVQSIMSPALPITSEINVYSDIPLRKYSTVKARQIDERKALAGQKSKAVPLGKEVRTKVKTEDGTEVLRKIPIGKQHNLVGVPSPEQVKEGKAPRQTDKAWFVETAEGERLNASPMPYAEAVRRASLIASETDPTAAIEESGGLKTVRQAEAEAVQKAEQRIGNRVDAEIQQQMAAQEAEEALVAAEQPPVKQTRRKKAAAPMSEAAPVSPVTAITEESPVQDPFDTGDGTGGQYDGGIGGMLDMLRQEVSGAPMPEKQTRRRQALPADPEVDLGMSFASIGRQALESADDQLLTKVVGPHIAIVTEVYAEQGPQDGRETLSSVIGIDPAYNDQYGNLTRQGKAALDALDANLRALVEVFPKKKKRGRRKKEQLVLDDEMMKEGEGMEAFPEREGYEADFEEALLLGASMEDADLMSQGRQGIDETDLDEMYLNGDYELGDQDGYSWDRGGNAGFVNAGAFIELFRMVASSPGATGRKILGEGIDSIVTGVDEGIGKVVGKKLQPSHLLETWVRARSDMNPNIYEAWRKGNGQAVALEKEVRITTGRLNDAIEEVYGSVDNVSVADARRIDAALRDPEGYKDLPRQLQGPVNRMRLIVDRLSSLYISEHVVEGKMVAVFKQNLGAYLRRSYRAFNDPGWMRYVLEYKPQVVAKYKEHIRSRFEMPDLDKADWKEMQRLAEVYGVRRTLQMEKLPVNKQNVKDRLSKITPAMVEDRMQLAIEDILRDAGESTDMVGLFGRVRPTSFGEGKDLSNLKKRKLDDEVELRALLGEYDGSEIGDTVFNFMNSALRMSKTLAAHKFMGTVLDIGTKPDATFLFAAGDPRRQAMGATKRIASETNQAFAPLNGLYTTPEVYDMVSELMGMRESKMVEALGRFGRTLAAANAIAKWGKTIANPVVRARNVLGAVSFDLMHGHTDLFALFSGQKSNRQKKYDLITEMNAVMGRGLSKGKYTPEMEAEFLRYAELGLIDESANLREIYEMMHQISKDPNFMAKQHARFERIAKEKFGEENYRKGKKVVELPLRLKGWLEDTYSAVDGAGRISFFMQEMARYKTAMHGSADAQLTPEQTAELETIALKITRDCYPQYSEAGRVLRAARRQILIGPFVTFPYEMIRTSLHAANLIRREIASENPAIRRIGMHRAAAMTTYNLIAAEAIKDAAALVFGAMGGVLYPGDDEEPQKDGVLTRYWVGNEQEKRLRTFYPPWMTNSQTVVFRTEEEGSIGPVFNVFDMSNVDPTSYMKTMIIAGISGYKESGSVTGGALDLASEFLDPFISPTLVVDAIMEAGMDAYTGNTRITLSDPEPTPEEQANKFATAAMTVLSKMQPGILDSGNRVMEAMLAEDNQELDPYGTDRSAAVEITSMMTGLRTHRIDIGKALFYKSIVMSNTVREISSAYSKAVRSGEDPVLELAKANEKRERLFNSMVEVVQNTKVLGMTRTQIDRVLTDRGVSKQTIADLHQGVYKPWAGPDAETSSSSSGRGRTRRSRAGR